MKHALELIAGKAALATPRAVDPNAASDTDLIAGPPQLKPMSTDPINLKMTNDARQALRNRGETGRAERDLRSGFHFAAHHGGFAQRTLEEALDDISLESKSFWKPLSAA